MDEPLIAAGLTPPAILAAVNAMDPEEVKRLTHLTNAAPAPPVTITPQHISMLVDTGTDRVTLECIRRALSSRFVDITSAEKIEAALRVKEQKKRALQEFTQLSEFADITRLVKDLDEEIESFRNQENTQEFTITLVLKTTFLPEYTGPCITAILRNAIDSDEFMEGLNNPSAFLTALFSPNDPPGLRKEVSDLLDSLNHDGICNNIVFSFYKFRQFKEVISAKLKVILDKVQKMCDEHNINMEDFSDLYIRAN